jgi:hypothetical protein
LLRAISRTQPSKTSEIYLRSGSDLDLAFGVARQVQLFGQFEPEAVAGKPDRADCMHRAVDIAREARGQGARTGLAAEHCDLDAAAEVLVDNQAKMTALLQHVGHRKDRVPVRADQFCHRAGSCFAYQLGEAAVRRRFENDGRIEAMRRRGDSGQLPVRKMRRDEDRRLAVVTKLIVELHRAGRELHAASIRIFGVEVPHVLEVHEFTGDPAQVLPDAAHDLFDLFWRTFPETTAAEAGAGDLRVRKPRADPPRDAARR